MQAALDAANGSAKVYLVEKEPSIGGRMAQLDKTFPTLDCSMCIESPRMAEVARHPNIELLTCTTVEEVRGEVGNFLVTLKSWETFVDDNCKGCGDCAEVCPRPWPNEFDMGLSTRKAIYRPFPQAVPSKYVIDKKLCVNCQKCIKVCESKAISFDRDPELKFREIHVGAIIAATGVEQLDPRVLGQYKYTRHPDVMTSLEFERLLSASGPSGGKVIKPLDKEVPESIVFVQCVGSRDTRNCTYCSRVCCMYSLKQAILAKQNEREIKEITILYMDIQAYGKGFENFVEMGKELGINFVRGRGAEVRRADGKLVVSYEDTINETVNDKEVDLVVLASALVPSEGSRELAEILGIELDSGGFFRESGIVEHPVKSSRDGVYICGGATGPKDICDSVTQASAAAKLALLHINERFIPEKREVEPIPVCSSDEPRIGIFVCRCGTNIGKVVDVPAVVEEISKIPGVVVSHESMFACSGSVQKEIVEAIKEKGLNRIIVAACSPSTHGPIFMDVLENAGLNPYLLEMANIRNQNSWVHQGEKEEATNKAIDLVRMAVGKVATNQPLERNKAPVVQKALVVGGGVAGISAAVSLAEQGIEVHLVEREEEIGGLLRNPEKLAPHSTRAGVVLHMLKEKVHASGVNLHLGTMVDEISGYVGNFDIKLLNGKEFEVGAVVVAVGADLYLPIEFNYGSDDRVITNLELERRNLDVPGDTVTLVSCVGSRNELRGCSRYCCQIMFHQALRLAEKGKRVNVLYKDIRLYSKDSQDLHYEAMKLGVRFFRYDEDPVYSDGTITFFDTLTGEKISLGTDVLVLGVAMVPTSLDDTELLDSLKLSKSGDGFLMELHPKLGPVETTIDGVFLAGTVQGPKSAAESVAQGIAAAAKAAAILTREEMAVDPLTAIVDTSRCRWCGKCEKVCEYGAIEVAETEEGRFARVNEILCKGCGMCVVECPTGALDVYGSTASQIREMIDILASASGNGGRK